MSVSYPIEDLRVELLGLDPIELRRKGSRYAVHNVVNEMAMLGIAPTTFHRWFRQGRISRRYVEQMAEGLGVHPAELVSSYYIPTAHCHESNWMTFTTKREAAKKPGWYIECKEGWLGPHKNKEAAEKRLAAIISVGACRHEHTIVPIDVEKLV